uniref:Uncharacterized protein n=1 Tax=Cacopsylla melanoneura TaxID=428564 RepID=A0A8D8Z4P1_9HEMI
MHPLPYSQTGWHVFFDSLCDKLPNPKLSVCVNIYSLVIRMLRIVFRVYDALLYVDILYHVPVLGKVAFLFVLGAFENHFFYVTFFAGSRNVDFKFGFLLFLFKFVLNGTFEEFFQGVPFASNASAENSSLNKVLTIG